MNVHVSLAALPGFHAPHAASLAIDAETGECLLSEPLFGRLSSRHVQLVPQSFGTLTEDVCDGLLQAYPLTQFRLHANARVLARHTVAALSGLHLHAAWFEQAARISRRLKAPAYSAHSGSRSEATVPQMLDNARRLAELFECPVAVEGQYPTKTDSLLVSTWDEYVQVFESGVPYVLDLSHINILATATRQRNVGLVSEMLACERCAEVHVSANDGRGDWHQVCDEAPWWASLLPMTTPSAVIFSEGNHRFTKR